MRFSIHCCNKHLTVSGYLLESAIFFKMSNMSTTALGYNVSFWYQTHCIREFISINFKWIESRVFFQIF